MEAKITNKVAERIIIVAGCRSWNRRAYDELIDRFLGEWLFVSNPGQLNDVLLGSQPRYIFFLRWSWMARDLIKNLRARTFPRYDDAYFLDGEWKVFLRLQLYYNESVSEEIAVIPSENKLERTGEG
jgi:hypothetical protein